MSKKLLLSIGGVALILIGIAAVWLFTRSAPNSGSPDVKSESVVVRDLRADQKSQRQGEEGIIFLAMFNRYTAIEGFPTLSQNGSKLYRMLLENEWFYSGEVKLKSWQTSGGRIRFQTTSDVLWLRVKYSYITLSNNLSFFGSAGFDIYLGDGADARCVAVTGPDKDTADFIAEIELPIEPDSGLQSVTINFPLYSAVDSVEIGLASDAVLATPVPHGLDKPIVFYGSSITQGACASRPGSSYAQIVTRALDAPLVNMGFSMGAVGEEVLANQIATFDMAALVMDYDYNAEDVEELQRTHFNFYSIIRRAHPDLPVILLSRVNDAQGADDPIEARRAVIKETYDRARAAGDRNIYFIDGSTVMGESHRDLYFVDGIHPNDIGHLKIAEALLPMLKKALKL